MSASGANSRIKALQGMQKEIAVRIGMSSQTAQRTLVILEERGVIAPARSNSDKSKSSSQRQLHAREIFK